MRAEAPAALPENASALPLANGESAPKKSTSAPAPDAEPTLGAALPARCMNGGAADAVGAGLACHRCTKPCPTPTCDARVPASPAACAPGWRTLACAPAPSPAGSPSPDAGRRGAGSARAELTALAAAPGALVEAGPAGSVPASGLGPVPPLLPGALASAACAASAGPGRWGAAATAGKASPAGAGACWCIGREEEEASACSRPTLLAAGAGAAAVPAAAPDGALTCPLPSAAGHPAGCPGPAAAAWSGRAPAGAPVLATARAASRARCSAMRARCAAKRSRAALAAPAGGFAAAPGGAAAPAAAPGGAGACPLPVFMPAGKQKTVVRTIKQRRAISMVATVCRKPPALPCLPKRRAALAPPTAPACCVPLLSHCPQPVRHVTAYRRHHSSNPSLAACSYTAYSSADILCRPDCKSISAQCALLWNLTDNQN